MKGWLVSIVPGRASKVQALDAPPSVEELQRAVGGGYFEPVPWFTTFSVDGRELCPCVAFCDEDGKRKQLWPNIYATFLWNRALMRAGRGHMVGEDSLCGPVCIVMGDDELLEAL